MTRATDPDLLERLRRIKLGIQQSLEHIGQRQDVSEGQRLLTAADRELMQLIRTLEQGQ